MYRRCVSAFLTFVTLFVAVSAQARKPADQTNVYTACNIWVADPFLALNIQSGPILPAGTFVSEYRVSGDEIVFTTANPKKTYTMEIVPKYHPDMKPKAIAQRFFTSEKFEGLTAGLTPGEIEMIRAARAAPGMSKRAVAIALGKPAEHKTPSMNDSKWTYWVTRRQYYTLDFGADGKVQFIKGLPGAAAEVATSREESDKNTARPAATPPTPAAAPAPPPSPAASASAVVVAERSNGAPAPSAAPILGEPGEGGTRWAVVVGISQYQFADKGGLTNLSFADDDANDFAKMLRKKGWSDSHIKLLVNEKATLRDVTIALESWLTKAGPDDLIVLFWSGHGFPDPEDMEKVYFACYDTDITIPATGYRMDKVHRALEERGTKNVVVIADTCHAGKIATRGNDKGVAITNHLEALKKQELPKGWVYMVGADTDRQAIEHSSWSNGAFTHVLLEGMGGKADGFESMGRNDGVVTLNELRAYMRAEMPDLTQKVLGVAKHPMITTSTGDPTIWDITLEKR
jgi:hypothetical protein